jgi:hypothetical protein
MPYAYNLNRYRIKNGLIVPFKATILTPSLWPATFEFKTIPILPVHR